MNRSLQPQARQVLLLAALVVLGATSTSRAGVIITPGSIPTPPATTLPAAHGTPLATGGVVTEEYSGLGLLFFHSAITEINGIKVWTPTGDFAPTYGSSLYYGPNATILAGFNVPGNPELPLAAGSVAVEFIGVPVGEGQVMGYDHLLSLHSATANNNENLVGPNGGILAILEADDLAAISISYPVVGDNGDKGDSPPTAPWGIASIEIGNLVTLEDPPPVNEAPEPGTLILAGSGLLGLLGYARRRRAR